MTVSFVERLRERTRAVLDRYPHGISSEQAVVIAYSELMDAPLDPFNFDDAAIILRSERLLVDGMLVADAFRVAREEMATFGVSA